VTTSPAVITGTGSEPPRTASPGPTPKPWSGLAADPPVEYLDLDDLLDLAERLFGPAPPIRDVGLLGSAVARPQTTAFGADAYPDLWTKAAALLLSLVKNHALVDGNKRLGWLATAVFLDINGIDVSVAGNDAVYELVMAVAGGHHTVAEVAERLSSLDHRRR
jgi:death-on-curing protein